MPVRVAVDAMGGDHAPRAIIAGAVQALQDREDLILVLVGKEDVIRAELDRIGKFPDRVKIVHASQAIEMDEPPTDALRQKKDSSIMVMTKMAAAREVDAVISAGNTGAFAAASQLRMRPLACVTRPGIAVTLPTFHGPVVLCDVGANIQAKPQHLYEYAVLATTYAQSVLGVREPRVGLVSIGEEDRKGTEIVKQTHEALRADPSIRFVGNVEGGELFAGKCEVAVCDGFVGNVMLKFVEGLSEDLFKTINREFEELDPGLRVKFERVIQGVWAKHDYSEYGGAPLLGIDGVCIICHGRSEERAIRNAVKAACAFLQHRFNDAVMGRLGQARVAG